MHCRVLHWQPNAGSTVNSQILNEVSQCVESINGVKEGRWKATLTLYKPHTRGIFPFFQFYPSSSFSPCEITKLTSSTTRAIASGRVPARFSRCFAAGATKQVLLHNPRPAHCSWGRFVYSDYYGEASVLQNSDRS